MPDGSDQDVTVTREENKKSHLPTLRQLPDAV
jgi:hypothetical protein